VSTLAQLDALVDVVLGSKPTTEGGVFVIELAFFDCRAVLDELLRSGLCRAAEANDAPGGGAPVRTREHDGQFLVYRGVPICRRAGSFTARYVEVPA
jgi:hypothetical protein